MFTGIVEEVGRVDAIKRGAQSLILSISGDKIFSDLHIGDSIAVNGVCLTVTSFTGHQFTADVMPESVSMTTLISLKSGDPVNLERAMAANGRFGGHIVAGHVDGTGRISNIRRLDNSIIFRIEAGSHIMDYIIYKGSVAIDGTSLTISDRGDTYFQVSVIPHTIKETILANAVIGTTVNLETDITGRYIRHFMSLPAQVNQERSENFKAEGVTKDMLLRNGFL